MRLLSLGVLLLLVGGCAQPPATESQTPTQARVVHYVRQAQVAVLAADAHVCPSPVINCVPGGSNDLVVLGENQTLDAYDIRIEVVRSFFAPQDRPVHVEVQCEQAAACARVVAQADGLGPFRFQGNLSMAPGGSLVLAARVLDASPDPGGLQRPLVRAVARLDVHGPPAQPAEPGEGNAP